MDGSVGSVESIASPSGGGSGDAPDADRSADASTDVGTITVDREGGPGISLAALFVGVGLLILVVGVLFMGSTYLRRRNMSEMSRASTGVTTTTRTTVELSDDGSQHVRSPIVSSPTSSTRKASVGSEWQR